jgi:hypothetical protein
MNRIVTLIVLTMLLASPAWAQMEQVWIKGNLIPPDTTAATPHTWTIVGDTLTVNGYVAAIAPPAPPTRRPNTPSGNLSQAAYDAMRVAKNANKSNYAIAQIGCDVFGSSPLVVEAKVLDETTILVTWVSDPAHPEYARIPTRERSTKRSGSTFLQETRATYEHDLSHGKALIIYSSSSFTSVGPCDWPAWRAEIELARATATPNKSAWTGHLLDPQSALVFRNPATLTKVRRVAG